MLLDEFFPVPVFRIILTIPLAGYYWLKSVVNFFASPEIRFKDISSDIALVTGAGSGIGRCLAIRLAKRGAKVVLWDISEPGLFETLRIVTEEAGGTGQAYVCDVTNKKSVEEVAEKVRREVGVVTILVNNAGIVTGKLFWELKDADIIKTFEVSKVCCI